MKAPKALMINAYCSYVGCENIEIYPAIMLGTKCPKCNMPLSWSGWHKIQVREEKDGRTRLKTTRELRPPIGKWKKGRPKSEDLGTV